MRSVAGFLIVVAALGATRTASATDGIRAVVEKWHAAHFTEAASPSPSAERAVLEQVFDIGVMARFALGNAWRSLPAGQKDEYLSLYADHVQSTLGEQREMVAARDVRFRGAGLVDAGADASPYVKLICAIVDVVLLEQEVAVGEAMFAAATRKTELLTMPKSAARDAEVARIDEENRLRASRMEIIESVQARGCQPAVAIATFGNGNEEKERIGYSLVQLPSGWRLVDVNFAGLSMIAAQRIEFKAATREGTDVPALLAVLRQRYAR